MSEWWTYHPSDFLMFSPQIYWRLFASLNAAFWPLQPLLVIGAAVWLVRLLQVGRGSSSAASGLRAGTLVLALCWLIVAWAFLWHRFSPINWAAAGMAWAFAAQGLLLLVSSRVALDVVAAPGARRGAALALAAWALLGHPLLGWLLGRPLAQAEVFGLAPDPTVVGSLAWLLLVEPRNAATRWLLRLLWIVPLGWCLASAAMFWAMGDWQGWLMPAAALIATAAAVRASPRSRHRVEQDLDGHL